LTERPPDSFGVDRIDHVEVFVRDLEAARTWYLEVLGLEEIHRWDPEPVMIGAGGTMLALFRAQPGAGAAADDEDGSRLAWRRVAWATDRPGFERAQAHLRRHGVPFHGPVDHGISRSIYFADLDGHPLEITCPSP
jgi:catechol 2,3-dioxygenase-like lactoylglutathione lyase family enzyme